jgi:hypothetical protein
VEHIQYSFARKLTHKGLGLLSSRIQKGPGSATAQGHRLEPAVSWPVYPRQQALKALT